MPAITLQDILRYDIGVAGVLVNGTPITASGTQLNYLTGVTPGAALPSLAVVLDANKNFIGGNFFEPFFTASTSNVIPNNGVVILGSSVTTAAYSLAAPQVGSFVTIYAHTTATASAVTIASGNLDDGGKTVATFPSSAARLILVGLSTASYAVFGNVGTVALA